MSVEEAEHAAILREDNEKRCRNLEAKTNNQATLENAFDVLRLVTFVEHLAIKLDIKDECELDFEGRRADELSKIEHRYEQMLAAKEAAERQAKLAGGPVGVRNGMRMVPGQGGIIRPQ